MTHRSILATCALVIAAGACATQPASRPSGGSGSGSGKADGNGSGDAGSDGSVGSDGSDGSAGSDTGSAAACLTNDGVDCAGNVDCQTCIDDGECASGPDPVWDGTTCQCFDDPSGPGCTIGHCCADGEHWDHASCECVAGT